jgi:hypothetical protein
MGRLDPAPIRWDGESRITERAQYLHVDFGSCNRRQISEAYRSFVHLCVGKQFTRALLTAGDNDPAGHRNLREALWSMARSAAISADFKLALVPSTPSIRTVFLEAQQALRATGLNAWVFSTDEEAVEWLEGRMPSGQMAS